MKHQSKEKPLNWLVAFSFNRMTEDDIKELHSAAARDGYALGFARAWHYFTNHKSGKRVFDYLHDEIGI